MLRSRSDAFYHGGTQQRAALGDITNVKKQPISDLALGYIDSDEEQMCAAMPSRAVRRPLQKSKLTPVRDPNADFLFGGNPEGSLRSLILNKLKDEDRIAQFLAPQGSLISDFDRQYLIEINKLCLQQDYSIDTIATALCLFHQILAYRGRNLVAREGTEEYRIAQSFKDLSMLKGAALYCIDIAVKLSEVDLKQNWSEHIKRQCGNRVSELVDALNQRVFNGRWNQTTAITMINLTMGAYPKEQWWQVEQLAYKICLAVLQI